MCGEKHVGHDILCVLSVSSMAPPLRSLVSLPLVFHTPHLSLVNYPLLVPLYYALVSSVLCSFALFQLSMLSCHIAPGLEDVASYFLGVSHPSVALSIVV